MTRRIAPLPRGAQAALAPLHRCCFPEDPWDEPALERILALAGIFGRLAWEDDDPAGFVLARDLGAEAEVLSLGVMPASRRRGVGRALLEAAIAEAEQRRLGSVVLEVAADNAAARRLYETAGFVPAGRRPRYYRRPGGLADGLILRRGIASERPEP